MNWKRIAERAVGFALLVALALHGQDVSIQPRAKPSQQRDQAEIQPNLRIDTSLVQVPVTVTDKWGRTMTGLEKKDFRIFDDNVEQTITRFTSDDQPVAVGFVFDVSGSIGGMLGEYRMAAHEFFRVASDDDEFFLVTFASSPKLLVPLTKGANEIEYQIMMTRSKGQTALFDAVYLAANEIRRSTLAKKALILISDGGENHSRYRFSELKNALRESDALLYSIGPSPDYRFGNGGLLKRLSEMTGGRLIEVGRADMADLSDKIIIDLRNRYVLYYSPSDKTRDGRYHRIEVRLLPQRGLGKLTAHWRTGYYAPGD